MTASVPRFGAVLICMRYLLSEVFLFIYLFIYCLFWAKFFIIIIRAFKRLEATLQASMCHQFMPLSSGFQSKMLLKYFGCNSCLFPYSSAEYLRRQYRHAMICHNLVFQIHANAIFFLSFENTHESTIIHFLMKQNFTSDISKAFTAFFPRDSLIFDRLKKQQQ